MPGRIKFGVYELDADSLELRKQGVVVRLQEQPLRVLVALTERPGEIVTREQLQTLIWGKDTFVDFEQSLNKAVNRLREALNDAAGQPRYVETVPRRGYRFVAPVSLLDGLAKQVGTTDAPLPPASAASTTQASARPWRLGSPWRLAILAGVFLLLAAATAYLLLHPASAPAQQVTVVPFTTYPGSETNPSFSPDGNQIAFAWTGGETASDYGYDLYVKQVGVEKPVRLTTHPALDVWPAWSPDGRFIAFARSTSNSAAIYIIPAIGGSESKLADMHYAEGWFDQLSWSPDSKWLAFADLDTQGSGLYGAHAYLLNLDTREKRRIADPSPQCISTWMPVFSPDGRSLALACGLSVAVNLIYVQPANGGPAHEVVHANGGFGGLRWTEDGKNLIYNVDASLWRVPVTGGSPEQLLYAEDALAPALAPSGKRLAYQRVIHFADIWRLDLSTPTKPKGAAKEVITSTYGQCGPHISPDGRKIAFNSGRSGTNEIWASDSDGSNPVQLTYFTSGALGVPQWSPDSQRIAFDTNAGGQNVETYTMRTDGGVPQRLNTGTDTASHPSWSGDGRWIYFDQDKHRAGVWKVAAEGGKAVRLTSGIGVFPQESAEGSRVFFVKGGEGAELWSVAPNGGDEHPVEGMPIMVEGWHWAPARSGIYFIDGNARPATLNLFDLLSHRVQRIGNLRGPTEFWGMQPSISRDGRTLVYAQADRNESEIMLVEGFQ